MRTIPNRKMIRPVVLLLCSALMALSAFCTHNQPPETAAPKPAPGQPDTFQLANGLTVILLENHDKNQIAIESFYRGGFINEPQGKAHISHVVEHLVCYGATKGYQEREAFNALNAGGVTNAETYLNWVHYDYVVTPDKLEFALDIEAQRLTSLRISDELLQQEIPKCLQEIEFVQQNQGGLIKFGLLGLNQVLQFGEKNVPVCAGTTKLTLADVKQFHKGNYTTDNAVLIIVGDFNAQTIKGTIDKYFKNIPPSRTALKTVSAPANDVAAQWDFASDAVYLVYPGNIKDAQERLALTLFGTYLSQVLFSDADLKKVAKISLCSQLPLPVGEWPFFVFSEARAGQDVKDVQKILEKTVAKTLNDFNPRIFSQTKSQLAYFMQHNDMAAPYIPENLKLLQQAVNLGLKYFMRADLSQKDFIAALDNLSFENAANILTARLSNENAKRVVFTAVKDE